VKQHEMRVARSCLMGLGGAVLIFCHTRLKTAGLRFVFGDVFEVALGRVGIASGQDETCSDTKVDVSPKG